MPCYSISVSASALIKGVSCISYLTFESIQLDTHGRALVKLGPAYTIRTKVICQQVGKVAV
jgi:hypothetical protein